MLKFERDSYALFRISLATLLGLVIFNSYTIAQAPDRDLSIGKNGIKWINLSDTSRYIDYIADADIDSSGNIYMIGIGSFEDREHFITKVKADGSLDTSFNEKGFREIGFRTVAFSPSRQPYKSDEFVRVNASQSHVWIIHGYFGGQGNLVTIRMHPDGRNDSSYGGNGYRKQKFQTTAGFAVADVLMTKDNGFILVGKRGASGTQPGSICVIKLNADGNIDSIYNGGNVLKADFKSDVRYQHASLMDDGSLFVTLSYGTTTEYKDSAAIVNLTPEGRLNPGYGANGIARMNLVDNQEQSIRTVFMGDGSMVAVVISAQSTFSNTELFKFTAAGVPDPAFGTGGRMTYEGRTVGYPSYLYNRSRDPFNRNILAIRKVFVSTDTTKFISFQLDANGELKLPFKTTYYSKFSPAAVSDQYSNSPEGAEYVHQWYKNKFYFFGRYGSNSEGSALGVTRANENIEPDSSFGNNGKARIRFNGSRDEIYMVEPVSTGGFFAYSSIDRRGTFLRFTNNGILDKRFGNNGMVFPDDSFSVKRMKVDNYNRLLLFCWHPGSEQYKDVAMVVKRLLENGRTDSSFGNNGVLLIQNIKPEKDFSFREALIQYDNKILIYYNAEISSDRHTDIGVLRLNEDGSIDNGFGTGGRARFDVQLDLLKSDPFFGGSDDVAKNFLVLRDSSIVLLSSATDKTSCYGFKLTKDGKVINQGGKNGVFNLPGGYHADLFFMGQTDSGRVVMAWQDENNMSVEVDNLQPDLSYSKEHYGNYFSSWNNYFSKGQLLHSGTFVMSGIQSDSNFKYSLVTVALKPGVGRDPAFGTNGILSYNDILPDTLTIISPDLNTQMGSSNKFTASVIDSEGQLATFAVAERNYLQDIVFIRHLTHDTIAAKKPVVPVITASPSAAVCGNLPVTLTADAPGCVRCTYVWSNGAEGKSIAVHQAGTYTVTVTNSGGSSSASRAVTMGTAPDVSITPRAATVCSGKEFQLTATGAASYTWQGPGLLSFTGNVVKAVTSQDAIYIVTGTSDGCIEKDTVVVKVISSVVPSLQVSFSGCPSDSLRFRATSVNAGGNPTFKWYVNGNYSGAGAEIILTGLTNSDDITCTLLPDGICTITDSVSSSTIVNCISAKPVLIDGLDYFNIAPNPVKDIIRLKFKLVKNVTMSLEIKDNAGRTIYRSSRQYLSGEHTQTINLMNLTGGLYFLTVRIGNDKFTRAFVKTD